MCVDIAGDVLTYVYTNAPLCYIHTIHTMVIAIHAYLRNKKENSNRSGTNAVSLGTMLFPAVTMIFLYKMAREGPFLHTRSNHEKMGQN
jgi:uncharacterized membrane protein YgdD (TMEM256/DUF423 family)